MTINNTTFLYDWSRHQCDISYMYNDVFQYWFKRFNNKLKLPTQTKKLQAPRSASHRSLVPETLGGVTIASGGGVSLSHKQWFGKLLTYIIFVNDAHFVEIISQSYVPRGWKNSSFGRTYGCIEIKPSTVCAHCKNRRFV